MGFYTRRASIQGQIEYESDTLPTEPLGLYELLHTCYSRIKSWNTKSVTMQIGKIDQFLFDRRQYMYMDNETLKNLITMENVNVL